MNKQQLEDYYERKITSLKKEQVVLIFFIFFAMGLTAIVTWFEMRGTCEVCDNRPMPNFIKDIEIISNNCGSGMSKSLVISTQYLHNGYFIYKEVCKADGYCKYQYIPIEECLS